MNNYKKNYYSQNGEDGIVEYLLSVIPKTNWCCEFGAWDGKHLSNTFHLVEKKDYNAVYIESDDKRYEDLLKTQTNFPKIIPKKRLIDLEKNSLDIILSETEIPKDFDILSIDVDSIDYAIWDSLKQYKPKIVIIEINSSLNPEIIYEKDELTIERLSIRTGVNFKTCYELGVQKGYNFVCHTGNMFFIDTRYSNLFENLPNENNFLSFFDKKWYNG
jgi:hypothetical protein